MYDIKKMIVNSQCQLGSSLLLVGATGYNSLTYDFTTPDG